MNTIRNIHYQRYCLALSLCSQLCDKLLQSTTSFTSVICKLHSMH